MIPIYQVTVPEYKFKRYSNNSKKIDYAATPLFNIKVPKSYLDNAPDFEKIGAKVDNCLKRHFLGKSVAVRVLSSEEHKGKSLDKLINIIKKLGHDRYNPEKKGDRYENLDNKHIDFFALDFKVKKNESYFASFIEPFYFWPIADNRKPVRIDLAVIYDLSKLDVVEHRYEGREKEIKRDGFIFKNPNNKPDALLGMIKIL